MRKAGWLVGALLAALATPMAPVSAQPPSWGDDFEGAGRGVPPPTWQVWPSVVYHAAIVDAEPFEGRFALVFEPRDPGLASDLAHLTQTIDAVPYRGKRVRLRVFARTAFEPSSTSNSARLWFVVTRPGGASGTNLRPSFRSDHWRAYQLLADIAPDADSLTLGVIVLGGGRVWLDSVSLVVTGEAAPPPVTDPGARAYFDSALNLIASHFVHRQRIAWDSVRARAVARAEGATGPAGTYDAIREALRSLLDRHSFLMVPEQGRERASGPFAFADSNARMVAPGVVWLAIPPVAGWDSTASARFARSMQDAMARLAPRASCGWIVDLRTNTGGNMWPMLAGVGPLLGEGVAGAFLIPGGSRAEWSYVGGEARRGDSVVVRVPDAPFSFGDVLPPVAVLIGPFTASSGEMIAISFRGRPDTRMFGRPTAGLTTATRPFPLPDSAYIIVSAALVADRNGSVIADVLRPDAQVGGGPEGDPEEALAAAMQWLVEHPDCASAPSGS